MEDGFERNLWIMIAERVFEIQHKVDLNRATMNANAIGKMFK